MSSRQIALLRGINVGRAKRIAMADLRALFERLGFSDVRTLLNSGNVVFGVPDPAGSDTASTASRIEAALTENLGVSSRIIVLTSAELAAIVAGNPLLDVATDPSRLLVSVLRSVEDGARLAPFVERDWGADKLAVGPRVAYLWCPKGLLDSDLATSVGRALGDAVTTRNWATILKLQSLAGATP